uniref:LIM domain-containing protein n=1 Tax=Salmonella sp. s55004 TaxID=3159675 RepID=UPI00397F27CC
FRCAEPKCKKTLAQGQESVHDDQPYCKGCYGNNFGPSGFHAGGVSHSYVNKK